jgi:hypothetical protein
MESILNQILQVLSSQSVFLLYPETVTAVVGWRRWGPRYSVVRVHLYLGIEHWMKKQQKRMNETVLSGTESQNWKQLPTNTGGNRLPKYVSKSETTNDSCLWLGTIPGQTHRNTTHRTNIEMKNIECPPQLTPWPNQNRDIKKELRSGCDSMCVCMCLICKTCFSSSIIQHVW